MQENKFAACLSILEESGAEFILVGGLAAVLQGAPVQTFDIDIVYSRAVENVQRLLAVLQSSANRTRDQEATGEARIGASPQVIRRQPALDDELRQAHR